MDEICRCSKCGRGYDNSVSRNLCEELHKPQHTQCVEIGSQPWDVEAVRRIIHSLAIEGPRTVTLTDKYQIIGEEGLEKVMVEINTKTSKNNRWVQVPSEIEKVILAAYHQQSKVLIGTQ